MEACQNQLTWKRYLSFIKKDTDGRGHILQISASENEKNKNGMLFLGELKHGVAITTGAVKEKTMF